MTTPDQRAFRNDTARRYHCALDAPQNSKIASQSATPFIALDHMITEPKITLEALGFIPEDIQAAFEATSAFDASRYSKRWLLTTEKLLHNIHPLPTPVPRPRLDLDPSSSGTSEQIDSHRHLRNVTVETMAALGADGCWVLLQCSMLYPDARIEISSVAAILLAAKSTSEELLSVSVRSFVRTAVLAGCFDGARLVLAASGIHPTIVDSRENYSGDVSGGHSPGLSLPAAPRLSLQDSLHESFLCPVTREVFMEPVTLGCGHNFERDIVVRLVNESGTLAACPICKHTLGECDVKVNIVLREAALRLFPGAISEARRFEFIEACAATGAALSTALELALRIVDNEAQLELRECAVRAMLCWAEGGMWPRDEVATHKKNEPDFVVSKMIAESSAALRCLWRTFDADMQLWVNGGMKQDRFVSNMIRCLSSSTALCLAAATRATAVVGLLAADVPALIVKCVAKRCCEDSYVEATVEMRKSCIRFLSVLVDYKHNDTTSITEGGREILLDSSAALVEAHVESSLVLLVGDLLEKCRIALHAHIILQALISASSTSNCSSDSSLKANVEESLDKIVQLTLDCHLAPVENAKNHHFASAEAPNSLILASCTKSLEAWQRQMKSTTLTSRIGLRLYANALRILHARAGFLNTDGGDFSGKDEAKHRLHLQAAAATLLKFAFAPDNPIVETNSSNHDEVAQDEESTVVAEKGLQRDSPLWMFSDPELRVMRPVSYPADFVERIRAGDQLLFIRESKYSYPKKCIGGAVVIFEEKNDNIPPLRVRWIAGGFTYWVHPSDLRHLVPGSAVEPSSGYILRIGPPPPCSHISKKSDGSASPRDATDFRSNHAKDKTCSANIEENKYLVKINREANIDLYRVLFPELRAISAALGRDLPAETSRLLTPADILDTMEEDFKERNLTTRSSVQTSRYSSAGLIFDVEASIHHDVWLIGIATGHSADAHTFEVWASDSDDANDADRHTSSASWNGTDFEAAPPRWKRVWGPGSAHEGRFETEYRFEYPLRVPAGSRRGLCLRGDNSLAMCFEHVPQEECDSPPGKDNYITIHAGYAMNPNRWATEDDDRKSEMVGRVIYTVSNPCSLVFDEQDGLVRELPSMSAVLGPTARADHVNGVRFISACIRELEERFADNTADFEAGIAPLRARNGTSDALLKLLRRRCCPVSTHVSVLKALLEFRSSRTLPLQASLHSEYGICVKSTIDSYCNVALKALWGTTEVDVIELSRLLANVADPSRGEPALAGLAFDLFERLHDDILSSSQFVFSESSLTHTALSNVAEIEKQAASLAVAVLKNRANDAVQSEALHTLSWVLPRSTMFEQPSLRPLFCGGALSVVNIVRGGICNIAYLSASSQHPSSVSCTADKNIRDENLVSGKANLPAYQAASILLNLIASHTPGVTLSALLACIVSTGAMRPLVARAEVAALGTDATAASIGRRVLEILAGGGRLPQTALLLAALSPTGTTMSLFQSCMQLWDESNVCDGHSEEKDTKREDIEKFRDDTPVTPFSDSSEAIHTNSDELSPSVAAIAQEASKAFVEARQGSHRATWITNEASAYSKFELERRGTRPPLLTSSFGEPSSSAMRTSRGCLHFSIATRAWVFGCLLRDDVTGLSLWAFKSAKAAAAAEANGRSTVGTNRLTGAPTVVEELKVNYPLLLQHQRAVIAALHKPGFFTNCCHNAPWVWRLEHLQAPLVGSIATAEVSSGSASVSGLLLPASCQSVLAQLASLGKPSLSVEKWFAGFTTSNRVGSGEHAAPSLFEQLVAKGTLEDEVFDLPPGSLVPGSVKFCGGQATEGALPQGSAVLLSAVGESEDAIFGTGEWNHFSSARDDDRGPVKAPNGFLRFGNEEMIRHADGVFNQECVGVDGQVSNELVDRWKEMTGGQLYIKKGVAVFTFQPRLNSVDTNSQQLFCLRGLEVIASRWDKRECHMSLRIKPPQCSATPVSSESASNADAFSGVGWTHVSADVFSFTYSRSQKKLIGRVVAATASPTASEPNQKDLVCSAFQLVVTVGAYNVGLHGLRLMCGDVAAAERACLSAGLPVQASSTESTVASLQSADDGNDEEQCSAHSGECSFDGTYSRGGAFASGVTLNTSSGTFGALCGPLIKAGTGVHECTFRVNDVTGNCGVFGVASPKWKPAKGLPGWVTGSSYYLAPLGKVETAAEGGTSKDTQAPPCHSSSLVFGASLRPAAGAANCLAINGCTTPLFQIHRGALVEDTPPAIALRPGTIVTIRLVTEAPSIQWFLDGIRVGQVGSAVAANHDEESNTIQDVGREAVGFSMQDNESELDSSSTAAAALLKEALQSEGLRFVAAKECFGTLHCTLLPPHVGAELQEVAAAPPSRAPVASSNSSAPARRKESALSRVLSTWSEGPSKDKCFQTREELAVGTMGAKKGSTLSHSLITNETSSPLLDGRASVCAPFGVFHGQRVQALRHPEWGLGTVMGVGPLAPESHSSPSPSPSTPLPAGGPLGATPDASMVRESNSAMPRARNAPKNWLWIAWDQSPGDKGATWRSDNWKRALLVPAPPRCLQSRPARSHVAASTAPVDSSCSSVDGSSGGGGSGIGGGGNDYHCGGGSKAQNVGVESMNNSSNSTPLLDADIDSEAAASAMLFATAPLTVCGKPCPFNEGQITAVEVPRTVVNAMIRQGLWQEQEEDDAARVDASRDSISSRVMWEVAVFNATSARHDHSKTSESCNSFEWAALNICGRRPLALPTTYNGSASRAPGSASVPVCSATSGEEAAPPASLPRSSTSRGHRHHRRPQLSSHCTLALVPPLSIQRGQLVGLFRHHAGSRALSSAFSRISSSASLSPPALYLDVDAVVPRPLLWVGWESSSLSTALRTTSHAKESHGSTAVGGKSIGSRRSDDAHGLSEREQQQQLQHPPPSLHVEGRPFPLAWSAIMVSSSTSASSSPTHTLKEGEPQAQGQTQRWVQLGKQRPEAKRAAAAAIAATGANARAAAAAAMAPHAGAGAFSSNHAAPSSPSSLYSPGEKCACPEEVVQAEVARAGGGLALARVAEAAAAEALNASTIASSSVSSHDSTTFTGSSCHAETIGAFLKASIALCSNPVAFKALMGPSGAPAQQDVLPESLPSGGGEAPCFQWLDLILTTALQPFIASDDSDSTRCPWHHNSTGALLLAATVLNSANEIDQREDNSPFWSQSSGAYPLSIATSAQLAQVPGLVQLALSTLSTTLPRRPSSPGHPLPQRQQQTRNPQGHASPLLAGTQKKHLAPPLPAVLAALHFLTGLARAQCMLLWRIKARRARDVRGAQHSVEEHLVSAAEENLDCAEDRGKITGKKSSEVWAADILLHPELVNSICGGLCGVHVPKNNSSPNCSSEGSAEGNNGHNNADTSKSQQVGQPSERPSSSVVLAAARLIRPSTGASLPAVAAATDYLAAAAELARLLARSDPARSQINEPHVHSNSGSSCGSEAVAEAVCFSLGLAAAALPRKQAGSSSPSSSSSWRVAPMISVSLSCAARALAPSHPGAADRWLQPLLVVEDDPSDSESSAVWPTSSLPGKSHSAAVDDGESSRPFASKRIKNNNDIRVRAQPISSAKKAPCRRVPPPQGASPAPATRREHLPRAAVPTLADRASARETARALVAEMHAAETGAAVSHGVAVTTPNDRAEQNCAHLPLENAASERDRSAPTEAADEAVFPVAEEDVPAFSSTCSTSQEANAAENDRNVSVFVFPSPRSEAQASLSSGAMFNVGDGVWQELDWGAVDATAAQAAGGAVVVTSSLWRVTIASELSLGDASPCDEDHGHGDSSAYSGDGGRNRGDVPLGLDCAIHGQVVGTLPLPTARGSGELIELAGRFAHHGLFMSSDAVHLAVRLNRAVPAGGGNFNIERAGHVELLWLDAP